ncbi:recombinase family protein [Mesobaculum littorinae]|uniref:Recombinase family protein n=1 Tax=Mesobaculum littorinae TaxID=2486419 RepID=A0A438ACY7_9RHOB|nr:recombinase family protein [Mesobaculum littorinae]RVV96546.1 recombinase family protein [Mesobaculum littorinae]
MSRIGYARVSSASQDLGVQTAALRQAGCDVIRSETGSGASRAHRGELATILDFLRAGDELVVHRLDRLGRSTRDVLNLVHELEAKGAALRVLEPEVSTSGEMGRMVLTVLGMVADMELKFIRDRQRAGIDAARARGVYTGRRPKTDVAEIRRLAAAGRPKAQIARDLKVSRMTVYRALAGVGAGAGKAGTPIPEKPVPEKAARETATGES